MDLTTDDPQDNPTIRWRDFHGPKRLHLSSARTMQEVDCKATVDAVAHIIDATKSDHEDVEPKLYQGMVGSIM